MKSSEEILKSDSGGIARTAYEFADLRVDLARRTLERNGKVVPLYPRTFDALVLMIEHLDQVLTKEVLFNHLWPSVIVADNSLARVISDMRKALGSAGECVVTVARRGYRFEGPVRVIQPPPTLAVLPFSRVGDNEADKLLAFGLADSLITRLSKIRDIIVRPTSSVASYTGVESPVVCGRELQATAVLIGAVRRFGKQVRITVQLVDVASEAALWADKFDEADGDIFTLEDAITERVARTLAVELTGADKQSLRRRYTADSRAYDLYLRGRFWLSQRTSALQNAAESFKLATSLDPDFALAYAGLAEACMVASIASTTLDASPPREMVPTARAAAQRALVIDEHLGQAHAVLGHIAISFDWDWLSAERHFLRAIRLSANDSTSHHYYAIGLSTIGRSEEALHEIGRARELEPTSIVIHTNAGFILQRAHRLHEAIAALDSSIVLAPHSAYARYRYGLALQAAGRNDEALVQFTVLGQLPGADLLEMVGMGHLLATLGRTSEAQQILHRLLKMSKQRYVSAYFIAEIYAGVGDVDHAFEWLEKAYEERTVLMISLQSNPKWDSLRCDSRFKTLVRRVGLWGA